jgi:hypothetical protein
MGNLHWLLSSDCKRPKTQCLRGSKFNSATSKGLVDIDRSNRFKVPFFKEETKLERDIRIRIETTLLLLRPGYASWTWGLKFFSPLDWNDTSYHHWLFE